MVTEIEKNLSKSGFIEQRRTDDGDVRRLEDAAAVSFVDLAAPPMRDILFGEIAPKYLTIRDFLNLGAVSQTYRALLGPKTHQGNRILGEILKVSSKHKGRYSEQLPTIGDCSIEASLAKNALLVAQLIESASKRRGLITFPSDLRNSAHEDIVAKYKSKRDSLAVAKLIVVNHSGRKVFCHWIGFDGSIQIRQGDCIPPCPDREERRPPTFGIRHGLRRPTRNTVSPNQPLSGVDNGNHGPEHIFHHRSFLFHAFALCFEEGGSPFAIYQLRRGWLMGACMANFETRLRIGVTHAHAIAILPEGTIEELHCDCETARESTGGFVELYHFGCRRTGNGVPSIHENGDANNSSSDGEKEDTTDETFAKAYYGLDALVSMPSLSQINGIGEAYYDEWTSPKAPPPNH